MATAGRAARVLAAGGELDLAGAARVGAREARVQVACLGGKVACAIARTCGLLMNPSAGVRWACCWAGAGTAAAIMRASCVTASWLRAADA